TTSGSNPPSIAWPGGRSLTVTTDGSGRITAISGRASLSASYTYDASGNLATATDAAGKKTTYTYDSRHQLLTVGEGAANGTPTTIATITYGTLGRVTQTQAATLPAATYVYAMQRYTG